jgi:hypothetical protein
MASFSTDLRNACFSQISAEIGTSGRVKIYSGAVPANVGESLGAAVELVDLECSATFADAPSGGVVTANAVTGTLATADGAASFFRITTSAGVAKIQGTVGGPGSGQECILNTTNIENGKAVSVTSLTLTEGNP